jgi:hypothetical protein
MEPKNEEKDSNCRFQHLIYHGIRAPASNLVAFNEPVPYA